MKKLSSTVCISTIAPSPTGSGGSIAAYGISEVLSKFTSNFTYLVAQKHAEASLNNGQVEFVGYIDIEPRIVSERLGQALTRLEPDIVWIHQMQVWPVFSPFRFKYAHVVQAGDRELDIEKIRYPLRGPARDVIHKVVDYLRHLNKLKHLHNKEKIDYQQASQVGVVANFSAYDLALVKKRLGLNIHYCPLAFHDWKIRRSHSLYTKPQVLLLGYLGGALTRLGLRYFFDSVWPVWLKSSQPPQSLVRVVGSGVLPKGFNVPIDSERLKWVGFVPDLEQEWNQATAILVPVPAMTGVRTRIIEAWCKGVPVIAHPSAFNAFRCELPRGHYWRRMGCSCQEVGR